MTEFYNVGDRVRFNISIDNIVRRVFADTEGEIISLGGPGRFLVEDTRGYRWRVKWYEVRPAGTRITGAMHKAIQADEELIADWLEWETADA